jgi:L-lysine exporter family protein LysE/ArgO
MEIIPRTGVRQFPRHNPPRISVFGRLEVYLETVVLLGAVSAQHQSPASFGLGAVLASFVFFFALGYGARFLSHIFESPTAWRFLDALVAILMFALAAKLIFYT